MAKIAKNINDLNDKRRIDDPAFFALVIEADPRKAPTHNVVAAHAATTIGSYAAASFFGGKRP